MKQKNYEITLILIGALMILFFISKKIELLIISLALIFCALFIKKVVIWISWLWLKFAEVLGNISSKIVLAFIFYFILTPLALAHRLLKKNKSIQLNKNFKDSYFTIRNHLFEKKDLEKIC